MKEALLHITYNGIPCTTNESNSVAFFTQHSKSEDDVWIINGFATKEAITLHNGDELFCIQKGVLPPSDALDALMRARHTPRVHTALKCASVAICGLGGLGSHIAIMLARSGIGKLVLIDFDVIEPSNLNRQAYTIADLGKHKTLALQEHIRQINPYTTALTHTLRIDESNIKQLFHGINIVCEAFDNAATKAMLARHFHQHYPTTPLICASGLAGYGASNAIQTKQHSPYLYICGDGISSAQVGRGLMAPRVTICAAHQANLVIELLVKEQS